MGADGMPQLLPVMRLFGALEGAKVIALQQNGAFRNPSDFRMNERGCFANFAVTVFIIFLA